MQVFLGEIEATKGNFQYHEDSKNAGERGQE